ncbi:isopeptide-forming domain-containing fimbrial protein [Virgibacillus halodenitrificans]|uniref:isopeptide-forming domain-containing fimbrial protein n=1 Tax=Virgibacillus halodenitrificans TaxID=1482 RepID=UPI00045CE502|nr:isopeptide-forming domain-containing fimbrial protein [Virgibacillus halodenitrificans]CDQ37697.1 hypothetical protein BN993_07259 [Virgibacillus halodenitrificans]
MKKNLGSSKIFLIPLLVFLSLFLFQTNTSAMVDKVKVVNKDMRISAKYKFIAQFNKSKTTVVPFGLKSTNTLSKSGKTPYVSFNPKNNNSLKGKFGVIYKNIGRYNDKEIDLKITVLDWKKYLKNDSGKISFQLNNIGENNQGYYYVDQKWEFYESGTNKKVKINGYMTVNDIDSLQSISFNRETSQGIKNILIDESAKEFLSFSNKNGELAIYEDNYILTANDELRAMATILYEGLDTLRFKWERDFDRSRTNANTIYDPAISDGEYFGYIAKKPAKTQLIDPSKTVENNGKESQSLNVQKNKTFSFNLYHQVPDEWSNFYYDNYLIEDNIDKRLSIESIKVVNEEDKDVTSYFINQTKDNYVKLAAKSTALKKSYFYNHTYKVIVNVRVKDSDTLTKDVRNGRVTFNNIYSVKSDNVTKSSNKVAAILNQREINVLHIDKINEDILKSTTSTLFDGDFYSYSSRSDLKQGKYSYIATPEETKKGNVDGKDIKLQFYYQLPLLDINMRQVKIFTDNHDKGLPVRLELEKIFPYGEDIPDLKEKKVKLSLFEKNVDKALVSKEYTLASIPEKLKDWTISKDHLEVNTHKNYVIKILGIDNKYVVSTYPEINTDGYTSSEKEFSIEDSKTFSYSGVVMTERTINQDMIKHYEKVNFENAPLKQQKTGYGFEINLDIGYTNDLLIEPNIEMFTMVNSELIDNYLNYPSEGGYTKISLDKVTSSQSNNGKDNSYKFKLPNVNVEKETGNLFTDKQVENEDSKIIYDTKHGGRKLYVPIWGKLKNYDIYLEPTKPIGINDIIFKAEKSLNVYAYMFATIGSETISQDEVLVEPVNKDNPFPEGIPNGWSQSDVDWLKK